ncbi:MAG: hypothetical protein WC325_10780 [Candidatus Bathyarchaeia archaeon]|jgi:hypothetical protein
MSNLAKKTRNRVIIIVIAVALLGSYIMFFTPSSGSNPPFDFSDITKPEGSATVYQALHVTYVGNSDRWVYPNAKSTTLTIVDPEANKGVTNIQTAVFINVNYDDSSRALTSWSFKADATLKISHSGMVDRQFTQQVTGPGQGQDASLPKKVDVQVTSASMSAGSFESLFQTAADTTYTLTVSLRNMEITLNFDDGSSEKMSIVGGANNDLNYGFKVISMVMGP